MAGQGKGDAQKERTAVIPASPAMPSLASPASSPDPSLIVLLLCRPLTARDPFNPVVSFLAVAVAGVPEIQRELLQQRALAVREGAGQRGCAGIADGIRPAPGGNKG